MPDVLLSVSYCVLIRHHILFGVHAVFAVVAAFNPWVDFCDGVVAVPLATASRFNTAHHMAHIAAPVGPEAFHPLREWSNELRAAVDKADDSAVRVIEDKLSSFRSITTYVTPAEPEENYCRHNLDELVRAIVVLIGDSDHIYSIEAKAVKRVIGMVGAKSSTSPEPVIIAKYNSIGAGLLTTEAKGVDASLLMSFAQAIQMASDCALRLCGSFDRVFNQSNVIVPFILCSWEHFQFGCVYMMPQYFPCPVLLSSALNAGVPAERRQIARWGVALADHCRRVGERIRRIYYANSPQDGPLSKKAKVSAPLSSSSSSSFSGTAVPPIGSFVACSKLLYKAIEDTRCPRAMLCRLLSVFYLLQRGSKQCQAAVCFPEGVVGLPMKREGFQVELYAFILRKLRAFHALKHPGVSLEFPCDSEGDPARVMPDGQLEVYGVGHPIVVYQPLDPVHWKPATELVKEEKRVWEQFLSQLEVVLAQFIDAGVVHMDIRLPNLFYHVQDKSTLLIKVIDWDDALLLGARIPGDMKRAFQGAPQFPSNSSIADGACHDHMVSVMRQEL